MLKPLRTLPRHCQCGFTLLELAIVLSIIGLIVGGVLGGQALIRSAELRAITTEKDSFVVAIRTFQAKYFLLPGDLPNAYQYWGATCGTDTTDASTGCNGNGDGQINADFGGYNFGEHVKVWEHLSRAGLIAGVYDGTGTDNGTTVEITTTNVPASKFTGTYWNIGAQPLEGFYMDDSLMNNVTLLSLGSIDAVYAPDGWVTGISNLTLGEAFSIDQKVDDGQSDAGKLRGNHDGTCADNGTDYYSLATLGATTNGNCIMTFMLN